MFLSLVNDDGDCKITQFSLLPPSGPQGTTFTIAFTYVTVNGTGTGEIDIRVRAPDHVPLVAGFLLEEKKPGTYQETITIKAEPDPSCDPTERESSSIITESITRNLNHRSFIF